MKNYKENILIAMAALCVGLLAALYGSIMAIYTPMRSGIEEFDTIVKYSIILIAIFMIIFYGYLYIIKKKFKGIVYFAYASKDKEIADYFKKNLSSRGYRCLPEEYSYKLGDNIYERMDRELSRSKALIVIISPNSKGMKLVNQPVKLMKKKKKKILPILVGNVETPQILSGVLSADYTEGSDKTLYLVLDALGESV